MTFDNFVKKLDNYKDFIIKESDKILLKEANKIEELNVLRLYETGKDTTEKTIGTYTPKTIEKRKAAGKPVPSDAHWVSYWQGTFLQEINVKEKSLSTFEIKSDFYGYPAMEKYNKNYLGLTDKESNVIGAIIAEKLKPEIVNYFK